MERISASDKNQASEATIPNQRRQPEAVKTLGALNKFPQGGKASREHDEIAASFRKVQLFQLTSRNLHCQLSGEALICSESFPIVFFALDLARGHVPERLAVPLFGLRSKLQTEISERYHQVRANGISILCCSGAET